jgi:16S rRNA (uracil1498-N3)-methyltransferase
MHRFFVEPELVAAEHVTLPAPLAHQVRDVLRLRRGEQIVLLDNRGGEFITELREVSRRAVCGVVVARRMGAAEPRVALVVYQGLLKAAKFEWILQKGTEMGVQAFVPVHCQRSVAGPADADASKIQRWKRILREAAEQCGRAAVPELLAPRTLATALAEQSEATLTLFAWEGERETTLRDALTVAHQGLFRPAHVALFIGPEGGFSAEEAQLAVQHGAQIVTLGQRILRAETAALAAAAIILYEFAELG